MEYNEEVIPIGAKLDLFLDRILNFTEAVSPLDFTEQRIVLYGAGDLGKMAVELLEKVNIKPTYIVDKNNAMHGQCINGVNIVGPQDILLQDLSNALFIVCIVKIPYSNIKKYLGELGCEKIGHFYDLTNAISEKIEISNGWRYDFLTETDKLAIRRVYKSLNNNISRAYYLTNLYWRIACCEVLFEEAPITTDNKFFPRFVSDILNNDEVFLDCGAYTGNTIQKFLDVTSGKFKKIIAFEPDDENYSKLENFVNNLDEQVCAKIQLEQKGIGLKSQHSKFLKRGLSSRFSNTSSCYALLVALDDYISEPVTFIKMHLEGMEYHALSGALKTIKKSRPIIAITLYHNEEGCYKIPLLLMDSLDNYFYYYRLHMYCGQSSVIYAIPHERSETF